jgi:cytidylate kinase
MESNGSRRLVVAMDGPGSSGKSTVGAAAAARLGYRFCDTGLFYRAVAWLALERGVSPDDGPGLAGLVGEIELRLDDAGRYSRVAAAGREVGALLRGPEIDAASSHASRQPALRDALLERQRALARDGGIVMAGRDIGTVVLPDANVKIYIDASLDQRARRRAAQRGVAHDVPLAVAIRAELETRDGSDAGRAAAPMRVAGDAIVIDTDLLDVESSIEAVVAAIRGRTPAPGASDAGAGQGASAT